LAFLSAGILVMIGPFRLKQCRLETAGKLKPPRRTGPRAALIGADPLRSRQKALDHRRLAVVRLNALIEKTSRFGFVKFSALT